MGLLYYDKEGLPISMQSWGLLMESPSYRIVQQDEAADGSWVSTVWLGLNHNIGGRELHIFETMVFRGKDVSDVIAARRYPTLSKAKTGHEELLKERNEAPRHHLRKLEP